MKILQGSMDKEGVQIFFSNPNNHLNP